MEDRYLFKAKQLDNEEWVVGSLISMPHGGYMIDRVADSRRFRVVKAMREVTFVTFASLAI